MSYVPSGNSDFKKSVRVATTANLNLASPGSSIDGVTLSSGDRVLVKNQNAGSQNGIYVFAGSSSVMTRANDANADGELSAGSLIPVEQGSTYADTLWMVATDGAIAIGTTSISFSQVSGSGGSVAAADVSYAGSTNLSANNVEAALDELDSEKAAVSHSHAISDVTNLQTSLDGKASSSHSHAISDVTNLQTTLDGKASSSHSHIISDVTGLQTALDGKAASSHSHAISDVTGLQTALDGKQATLGTGSITSSLILDGTIVNGDIATGAAIALSKLATDPLARANHTGTQTLSTISDAGTAASAALDTDSTFAANSDTKVPSQKAVKTALDLKLNASLLPAGMIAPYAGTSAPSGWLLCDGSVKNIVDYPTLGAALGSTFGGNGTTTFGVPDLRGRVPVGLDDLGGTDAGRLTIANTLGGSGGAQTHTLTETQIPAHDHLFTYSTASNTTVTGGGNRVVGLATSGSANQLTTQTTGGSGSHNNMQPYLLLGYIIKT